MSTRKGSALLIVLGMLSFMVVSAVGFSMFMRQSRLPSSYLRRNVASRYLVKAALANAIEELDCGWMSLYDIGERNGSSDSDYTTGRFFGIYDDPFPGCGRDSSQSNPQNGQRTVPKLRPDASNPPQYTFCPNGDLWYKRVFCPFGPLPQPTSEDDASDWAAPTVPTLTLEALAYLPPAIIDDVRQMSRATRTAQWHSLPYEAGRYAYTAVNVSDLFDINRLRASEPRNSGLNRITMASLFPKEPTAPDDIDVSKLTQLDNLLNQLEQQTVGGQVVPFVSLADFSLLSAGSAFSPFSKYIGSTQSYILQNGDATVANSLFTTDSWFPPQVNVQAVNYDLGGGHQPFKTGAFGDSPAAGSFLEVLLQKNTQDQAGEIFEKNLGIGLACLYDYLDRDSVPISLCLPTTEAVPMVVGVSAPAGLSVTVGELDSLEGSWQVEGAVTKSDGTGEVPGSAEVKRSCKKIGITSFGNQAIVKILTSYPFKRMVTSQRAKSFTVRGLMQICLAKSGMKCRLADSAKIKRPWPNAKDEQHVAWQNGAVADGVATFVSEEKPLTAFSAADAKTWSDTVDDSVELTFGNLSVEMPILWEVEEAYGAINPPGNFRPSAEADAPRQKFNSFGNLGADANVLRPLDAEGNFFAGWEGAGPWNKDVKGEQGARDAATQAIVQNQEKFNLQVALWIQVLDGNEIVDMVPACVADDNEWLGASLPDVNDVGMKCGFGVPILNFLSKEEVSYESIRADLEAKYASAVAFKAGASLYTVDPRFNFAPENWYAVDELQVEKAKWHDAVEQNYLGKEVNGFRRDRDMFMFVSDQEYLQDIGELQFLPVLQAMNGNGVFLTGDYSPNFHGEPLASRTGPTANFACNDYFWRTYTAYDNGDGYDPIFNLPYSGYPDGVRFRSGISGYKVNPYSDDNRVLSAAFVGTPYDYYIASTNEDSQVKKVQNITMDQMQSTYSFGVKSVQPEFKDGELTSVMDAISERIRSAMSGGDQDKSGDQKLTETWQNMLWQDNDNAQICDENKVFMDDSDGKITLNAPLHGVDRKFLCSFWHECFDNRQQLFLIFVRAEPTAIGGGAAGNVSSAQLGGRAVALVWRDPMPIVENGVTRQPRPGGTLDAQTFRQNYKKDLAPHHTRVLFYHQFD